MKIGFFGKLPSYGDFIQRNVSPALIKAMDLWIIQSIQAARGQLKQHWQQQYFTSPIWRFVISDGLLSEHAITGIMMPSVDKSGRCYPLVLICETNLTVNLFTLARKTDAMHQAAEEFFLSLLRQSKPDLDETNNILSHFYLSAKESMSVSPELEQVSSTLEICSMINPSVFDVTSCTETLLEHVLTTQRVKPTLWWTAGGVEISARQRYFNGMPPADCFNSFLIKPSN